MTPLTCAIEPQILWSFISVEGSMTPLTFLGRQFLESGHITSVEGSLTPLSCANEPQPLDPPLAPLVFELWTPGILGSELALLCLRPPTRSLELSGAFFFVFLEIPNLPF